MAGGLNLYGFAAGDPVNFSDPFGLCPVCDIADVGFFLYSAGKAILNPTRQNLKDAALDAAGLLPLVPSAGLLRRVGAAGDALRSAENFPADFATKRTKNWSAQMASERDARNLARGKLGSDPVEVAPNKWRSQDGRWQYRAKPGDVADKHIHLEQLNPKSGEVLQNVHLRWK